MVTEMWFDFWSCKLKKPICKECTDLTHLENSVSAPCTYKHMIRSVWATGWYLQRPPVRLTSYYTITSEKPWLRNTSPLQLPDPNGSQSSSWVVLLSLVPPKGMWNNSCTAQFCTLVLTTRCAQDMRCTLQQFGCSFISIVWLSLPRGRKPPGDKQSSSGGQLLFSFNLVFQYFNRLHFVLSVFSSI